MTASASAGSWESFISAAPAAADWRRIGRITGLGAVVALYLCLVGIVVTFDQRDLIVGIVSLGDATLIVTYLVTGYLAASYAGASGLRRVLTGALGGAGVGAGLSALVLIGSVVNLRAVLLQASPELYSLLTLGLGVAGFWVPTAFGAFFGAVGGATRAARPSLQRSLIVGALAVVVLGVFGGLLRLPLASSPFPDFARLLFGPTSGLTVVGAIVVIAGAVGWDLGARLGNRMAARRGGQVGAILGAAIGGIALGYIGTAIGGTIENGTVLFGSAGALIGAVIGLPLGALIGVGVQRGLHALHVDDRVSAMPEARQKTVRRSARLALIFLGVVFVFALPAFAGVFFAQVVVLVALYVLMGLGLNITLGLAGLLDLGFVAFFAVGAYTVGLLTSTAEYGIAQWSWWAAVPVAILVAMAFGAILGLPILGIRGDYLAIATLGFGEIIRLLVASDLLLPILGGPRGIINIPKPIEVPPNHPLAGPVQIYYIAIICAAIIAFIAYRLRASRLGRAWLAIREDEDVAEALGVNLVQTKLLAYILGAGFAGLGGAVFAALIGATFPSDVNLQISFNVAAIVIVGGMGSIPGVIVGAIFLIGLPELFREFSGYRLLFYGVALIAVMRFRPEGLIPSRVIQREMHLAENVETADASVGSNVAMREELPEVELSPDELPEAR
jgi:branched-chain amino acid transport system permease protein